jgi:hypothetical protein
VTATVTDAETEVVAVADADALVVADTDALAVADTIGDTDGVGLTTTHSLLIHSSSARRQRTLFTRLSDGIR